ncbi:unnamed protein product [Calypogeia fissa]
MGGRHHPHVATGCWAIGAVGASLHIEPTIGAGLTTPLGWTRDNHARCGAGKEENGFCSRERLWPSRSLGGLLEEVVDLRKARRAGGGDRRGGSETGRHRGGAKKIERALLAVCVNFVCRVDRKKVRVA